MSEAKQEDELPQTDLSETQWRALGELLKNVDEATTLAEAKLAVSLYAEKMRNLSGAPPLREMTLREIEKQWPLRAVSLVPV